MCRCAVSSMVILNRVNDKRSKAGLPIVPYTWLMVTKRHMFNFLPRQRSIGPSYIWDAKTATQIVNLVWDADYSPNPFRWESYYRDNPDVAADVVKNGGRKFRKIALRALVKQTID